MVPLGRGTPAVSERRDEWWALTLDERKRLDEVTVEAACRVKPSSRRARSPRAPRRPSS